MHTTAVPAELADRLGPEATLGLVGLFETSQRECLEMTITQATDRFERRLVEETSKLRGEIGVLRVELRDQLRDQLKWMFLFWIGQVVATAGVVGTMLR